MQTNSYAEMPVSRENFNNIGLQKTRYENHLEENKMCMKSTEFFAYILKSFFRNSTFTHTYYTKFTHNSCELAVSFKS